jgi:tetratricopeptide (TPR) repeat protein
MRPLVLSCVLFALAATARMAAAAAPAATRADTKVASTLHGIESALETQDIPRARQLTLGAVESWNTDLAGNPAQHADALQKLARLLLDASLAFEAELPLQRALAVPATGSATGRSLADIHVMLTECYFGQNKLDRARHHQEQAIAIRRQLAFYEQPQSAEVGDDLYNLGYICLQLEDLEAADAAWRERLDLLRRVPFPDPSSIASGLSDLAEVNRRLGRYEQTETLMREAVATSESRGVLDHTHAVYLNNLALLCWDEDRFDEAERLLRDALRITEADSATTPLRLMRAHENLGVLGRDQGKMEQAERSLLQALDIGTTALGENDPSLVTVLNGLGILYNDLERWDEALAAWNRALAILVQA